MENISDGVLFGALTGTRACSFTKKGIHHKCFPVKFVKFYGKPF